MTDSSPQLNLEIKRFLAIAIPLSAAYLAEYTMFITTKMVVGKLGYQKLAAVGIAGDLSFEILVILMALFSIVSVMVAQASGAGKQDQVGQAVRQGFIVATMVGLPAVALIWNLDQILRLTGQDEAIIELAIPYLKGLSSMALPILALLAFSSVHQTTQSSGRASIVMP